jgi:hypothetical protein
MPLISSISPIILPLATHLSKLTLPRPAVTHENQDYSIKFNGTYLAAAVPQLLANLGRNTSASPFVGINCQNMPPCAPNINDWMFTKGAAAHAAIALLKLEGAPIPMLLLGTGIGKTPVRVQGGLSVFEAVQGVKDHGQGPATPTMLCDHAEPLNPAPASTLTLRPLQVFQYIKLTNLLDSEEVRDRFTSMLEGTPAEEYRQHAVSAHLLHPWQDSDG